MASKDELQSYLKEKYSINKNISQSLTRDECERLLAILDGEPSAIKLIESFTAKNSSLGSKNAYYSRMRNQAETRFQTLKNEYDELETAIKTLEESKTILEGKRDELDVERQQLESQIQTLSSSNHSLSSKVQLLTTQTNELVEVNEQLQKDNKNLKNIVDQIRLRLAKDTKLLLQYEDSEIRKALIRLFRWTLG
ncbi:MAG: hypothetical protein HC881_10240 [Leptolyngbyaceae cyanobacterium SL_7_1]|nr:hypothetical protein [Leptolyngbyaceae cyanobacterium SL_7_1]